MNQARAASVPLVPSKSRATFRVGFYRAPGRAGRMDWRAPCRCTRVLFYCWATWLRIQRTRAAMGSPKPREESRPMTRHRGTSFVALVAYDKSMSYESAMIAADGCYRVSTVEWDDEDERTVANDH